MFIAYQLRFGIRDYEGCRKSGENGVGWEHQFVSFADDANLLDKRIPVVQKKHKRC